MTETEVRIPEDRETMRLAVNIAQSYLSRVNLTMTAFGGDRDYFKVLGYPEKIDMDAYIIKYKRQDVAGRIVDLPAQDTWKKPPQITEDGDDETEFVKDWNTITNKTSLAIWNKLSRADKLSGIGQFGILIIGLKDGSNNLEKPVNTEVLKATGVEGLLYLRPFSEASVEIKTKEENVQSDRYGKPVLYEVDIDGDGKKVKIHHTRVLHLADGKLDSEFLGTPRLERVFNRLEDLTKLIGGGAEATWLNMRQGTLMRPQEGFDGATMDREKLASEISEYAHDPLRMLWLEGVETEDIGRDKAMNVNPIFQNVVALLSASSGIPQRVLVGSAQGELASADADLRQWAGTVAERQKQYAEPEVLRVFIDILVQYGILSPYGDEGYHVGKKNPTTNEWEWPPLVEMSEKEKAEIAELKTNAMKNVSDSMAQYPANVDEIREVIGLPTDVEFEQEDMSEDILLKQMNDMKKQFKRGEISGEQVLNYAMSAYLNLREELVANNGE